MANTTTPYETYAMAGIKEEFADWVSNISPEYTPFCSMITKFPVKNTRFQWQQDVLSDPQDNAFKEGDSAAEVALQPTELKDSYTQIMRKVVMVTDTANAVTSYGREKELFYQLKKAAKELKRDQEYIFLKETNGGSNDGGEAGSHTVARLTKTLGDQIHADFKGTNFDTAAGGTDFETKLFEMTEALYTAGAEPTVLMYNPAEASLFAALQETSTGSRNRIFENDKRFVKQVETIVDPLGQEFKCIPNRWITAGLVYCFNPADCGQATLRAPQRVKLAKDGSYEKYMIEQEVGLRLNNDKAAALMHVIPAV